MNIVANEQIYPFDVDKTLISERRSVYRNGDMTIVNPYTGLTVYCTPHTGHIDLLKEMAGRDRFIIVWSAAGVQWARAVVEALGLDSYVKGHHGLVMTKPLGYVDDQKVEDFMKNRIYLEPEDRT